MPIRWRRFVRHRAFRAFTFSVSVFAVVMGLRATGGIQFAELYVYDTLLQLSVPEGPLSSTVVVVGASEEDLNRWGWPLPDAYLAAALDRLGDAGAAAVGIDLYRDGPRPPGEAEFTEALKRHTNVYVVFKFAGGENAIPPPVVLRGTDRVGFSDTITDPGGIMRRGLIFLDDGQNFEMSLGLRLALAFLKKEGIGLDADAEHPELPRLGRTTLHPLTRDQGAYVEMDDAGFQFLIDFKAGRRPAPTLTLGQVLDGKFDPKLVAGKVVVLGTTAESVKDFFYTPLTHALDRLRPAFGIEIHAQLVDQLIRFGRGASTPLTVLTQGQEASWIWVWCCIGGLAGLRLRSPVHYASAAALGVALLSGITYAVFVGGAWLPFPPALLGYLAAATIVTSLLSTQEKAQRELLMQIFSRNVSPAIADALWEQRETFSEGGLPRPQKLTATVLFTDLRGFTTVSEGMDPTRLMAWLNDYMEAMTSVVIAHHGVIDKFIGDSIMAVFGIPIPREHADDIARDARAAVDCSLQLARRLAELNEGWQRGGSPTIGMRIGIYTGPVVAGALGSAQRLNYTVIGDTVNTASRLESFDKDLGADLLCRILIGESTLQALGDGYDVEEVGAVSLKGKQDEVRVFMVRGAVETARET